jgi:hypothetical protein
LNDFVVTKMITDAVWNRIFIQIKTVTTCNKFYNTISTLFFSNKGKKQFKNVS